ncbi:hypothetical protein LshimejAT787_0602490 [Lyophyllum shimeji]|uniref:Aminoglycoside phosphotransferase domain-containing protein n=1 Tax=Lyophyllum shimeji TaxID=47721 RepID=A0A9P3UN94_LYOSH|nr:hypothetical protein LshimejAT787_0602490 [Lyophyllum shimeji]
MTCYESPISSAILPNKELLWRKTDVDLGAFRDIAAAHMQSPCQEFSPMNEGLYARLFLLKLGNGLEVVGRIALPVRDVVKTEAEVAAMETVRAKTSIPVPKVYLFCSDRHNPVGAEWTLMEYIPGCQLRDCFDKLSYPQKRQTATDLADVMSSLFSITGSYCGSILRAKDITLPPRYDGGSSNPLGSQPSSRKRFSLASMIIRFRGSILREQTPDITLPSRHSGRSISHDSRPAQSAHQVVEGTFTTGPVNDMILLDYPNQVPPELCGPFKSEREFLEAFAYHGRPGSRPEGKLERGPYEKVFEVYDAVRPLYKEPHPEPRFHLAHGDLSPANILVDPSTGRITGVVDWEMAGFRPAWLAAVSAGWFNDDARRFLMTDDMEEREGYDDESTDDTELREELRSKLKERSEELWFHNWEGVELRAIFYNLCQRVPGKAELWLQKYKQHEWPKSRGDFPFDVMEWVREQLELWG